MMAAPDGSFLSHPDSGPLKRCRRSRTDANVEERKALRQIWAAAAVLAESSPLPLR